MKIKLRKLRQKKEKIRFLKGSLRKVHTDSNFLWSIKSKNRKVEIKDNVRNIKITIPSMPRRGRICIF